MHLQHMHVHRRAEALFGFGNIAHEIDASDAEKRHVEKREPREFHSISIDVKVKVKHYCVFYSARSFDWLTPYRSSKDRF
jgi:hypothetical protein